MMPQQHHEQYVLNFSQTQSEPSCSNGSQWIWRLLKQCVENVWEYWSIVTGILSVAFFLFAALPQIYVAYKNGKVDQALSMGFLLCWLGGDITNFIGCYLTKHQPIQLVTAIFYVNMDIIMISQFAYYKAKNQKMRWSSSLRSFCFSWVVVCITLLVILPSNLFFRREHSSNETDPGKRSQGIHEMSGFICGYLASVFYLGSRFPQLYKNFQRKSTEGTSYWLFTLAMMGNCLYGLSLILKMPGSGPHRNVYVINHLPWLFGSFGVVLLDFCVTAQFIVYHKQKKRVSNGPTLEVEPLLVVKREP